MKKFMFFKRSAVVFISSVIIFPQIVLASDVHGDKELQNYKNSTPIIYQLNSTSIYDENLEISSADVDEEERYVTRGAFILMLYKLEGSPDADTENFNFDDVDINSNCGEDICWANEKGIVHGYGDGSKFGPDDNITRQDLAVILRNFAQYKEKNVNVTSNLNKFKDGNIVSDYAKSAVEWAVGKGVITGNNNGESLTPHANSTRAEVAGMIYNYCTKVNV